ncbi:hypothetical protein ABT337_33175 [Saccharopolyspora hirsuta]|uniref:Uncharacterized protein n=1 Tax=Saccharopolyspora hirsuta TaxID=1837 RepID=A0A5M7BMV2_SACHI|nr:hypothetical protein [Saccharopolyspora hirsuta]KAA5831132.1 hypothetical protein F1721_20425 [Saccharopolyspora hirsuta]
MKQNSPDSEFRGRKSQDLGADPAQADRAIRAWAQDLQEKANRQEISRIRITERSRSVTVTVDTRETALEALQHRPGARAQGNLTDTRNTEE